MIEFQSEAIGVALIDAATQLAVNSKLEEEACAFLECVLKAHTVPPPPLEKGRACVQTLKELLERVPDMEDVLATRHGKAVADYMVSRIKLALDG